MNTEMTIPSADTPLRELTAEELAMLAQKPETEFACVTIDEEAEEAPTLH